MAVKRCTFSNDLKAKDLCYSDEFFKLKSEKVIPSDSFSFDSYEAFKNINDFKTNNYSNLFLINKQRNSDWLKSDVKEKDLMNGLATTISWYAPDLKDSNEQGSWLYFAKNYDMFDIHLSEVDALITYGRPTTNYFNYIFYINFIDDNVCTISHTFGDIIFYLTVEDNGTIHFSKDIIDNNSHFIYSMDDNKMKLYKRVNHKVYNEVDEIVGTYNRLYQLALQRNDDNSAELVLSSDTLKNDDGNICYVTNNLLDFDFYVDASWVGYDRSRYISSINEDKSAKGLTSQAIIHHQYNKEDGFNFIPLKNNLTYKGNSVRGNNTNISDSDCPDVDYRIYTSINSGMNQEKGTDNIILNFTFVDQEYEVKDGEDLYFTIPEKSLETTNLLEPLWPYKYINLNDTKFIKNGAFGSNVPYFSDKVKKLQNYNSNVYSYKTDEHGNYIFDKDGNRIIYQAQPNNETYLCSWLYKKDHESKPVWLDRYYYPDFIERHEALKAESKFNQSFENIIDKNYIKGDKINYKDDITGKIHRNTYFDKISDMVIEAGNTYRYQRVSSDMINEVIEQIEPNRISTVISDSGQDIDLLDEFLFDNEHYRKLSYDKWNNTNSINFNTDIYLSRKKRMGIQLFGTDYTDGFNIQNRKDLAPFHYYATETVLYLLNNKFEIVHQFDFGEKYNDVIYKLFLGNTFDDVVVVSGCWMYILSYDLRLKSRIDMTAEQIETISNEDGTVKHSYDNAIYNLTNCTTSKNDKSLLNYPYGHTNFVTDRIIKTESTGVYVKDIKNKGSIKIDRKFIAPCKLNTRKMNHDGYILIQSFLCEEICKGNAILYKNNIYVPLNQRIMKIIMCPDCQKDYDIFNDTVREKYPACARILSDDEYFTNYVKTSESENDYETVGTEQGFIMVDNKIKHIFIDENENIYGLNFDQYGIAKDGDTIYGLYSNQIYTNQGQWWWLFNQSLSKTHSDANTSKYAEFASPNSIDRVKFNELGEMCLIRNFNNLQDNENYDNNKRMDIYDITKSIIYTYDLSSFEQILTLDSYNFIDEAHQEHTCFTALAKSYDRIFQITYISDQKKMIVKGLDLPTNTAKYFIETVNTNNNLRYRDYNALYFNLHIPSHYTYDYIATIKWSLDDIQDGWYNINVSIDLDKALFEVRINDIIYKTINENTHSWFKPYVSSNGTTFNTTYYIGTLGKKYGTTLNKILHNSPYDPYTCKNSKFENMQIYNRALKYYEYQAMRMRGKKINQMILTLPCGNRNSIDEMVRYFKYVSSPAISNKIKINIAGTGLKTEGEFDMLRKEIEAVLEDNKDCLVTVKDIEFVEIGQND